MNITLSERLSPFSHMPGLTTLLPGMGCRVQIFPCLIRIYSLEKVSPQLITEIALELTAPVEQFTAINDLEKGILSIFGRFKEGWIRYQLTSSADLKTVRFQLKTAPQDLRLHQANKTLILAPHESVDLFSPSMSFMPYVAPSTDRLFLGCHKAQDWELIWKRQNMAEIFPLWHRMGQLIPQLPPQIHREGTLSLLDICRASAENKRPEETQKKWLELIQVAFQGMIVPQLEDTHHLGFHLPPVANECSPLSLLSEGAQAIRQLFVREEGSSLTLLPHLLPSLPAGRLIQVPLNNGDVLSLEWSKKTIRRLLISTAQAKEYTIQFPRHVKSYRLRQNLREKGERNHCSIPLIFNKNCDYSFDNFE